MTMQKLNEYKSEKNMWENYKKVIFISKLALLAITMEEYAYNQYKYLYKSTGSSNH